MPSSRVSCAGVRFLVVFVVLALSRVAVADELSTARALEAKLEYEQALTIVDGLLAKGGADPARYVELHLLAGRLSAGLDRVDVARDHFARVLAIRPTSTLPDGTSPKITEPFAAAKARVTPLAVTITARRGLVSIEANDSVVTGIAVHVLVAGKHDDRVERTARRLVIPDDAQVIEVAALDAAGNRIWIGAPPATIEPVGPPRSNPRPLYAHWQTYAVIGGIALGTTGLAAWRFGVAQDEWDRLDDEGGHDFSELEGVERRGKRWGLVANIGLGAAAVSGVVAVIVGVRRRDDRAVAITPTQDGVAIFGRF